MGELKHHLDPDDVPQDPNRYVLTDHARHRLGQRGLNKKITHGVIQSGKVSQAAGNDAFEIRGDNGIVVIVSAPSEKISKNLPLPILTIYKD